MLDRLNCHKLQSCLADLRLRFNLSLKESYELAGFVLGFPSFEVPFNLDLLVSFDDFNRLESLAQRMSFSEPFAYILGAVEFHGCQIHINSNVLIPRFETELLVEKILEKYPQDSSVNVLDLCTGSGCIGLALKKHRPLWNVFMTDLSIEALKVADENAQRNGLSVKIFQGDLFEPLEGAKVFFDLIVSNPPYIPEKDYLILESSVLDYEPKIALTPGETGLEIYEKIASHAFAFLKPQGRIALEIGYDQKDAVNKLFSNGFYKNIVCEKDFASHDRFIFLELQ